MQEPSSHREPGQRPRLLAGLDQQLLKWILRAVSSETSWSLLKSKLLGPLLGDPESVARGWDPRTGVLGDRDVRSDLRAICPENIHYGP